MQKICGRCYTNDYDNPTTWYKCGISTSCTPFSLLRVYISPLPRVGNTNILNGTVNQYASLECEFKDLKEKFTEETKERKDLYNKLIEVKGWFDLLLLQQMVIIIDLLITMSCVLIR